MTGGRKAPRAERTADVRRGRGLAAGAIASAAAALVVGAFAGRAAIDAPRLVSRPHAAAHVACESCHGPGREGEAAASSCVGCHGDDRSTRPGHRALAERGMLSCAACHPAHGASAGVSFDAQGKGWQWAGEGLRAAALEGPPGADVPLIAASSCRPCHGGGAGDPAAACLSADAGTFSTCFDEHQLPGDPLPDSGACRRQHGPGRFVAWEAARRGIEGASVSAGEQPREDVRGFAAAWSTRGRAVPAWLWILLAVGAGGVSFAWAMRAPRAVRSRAPHGAPAPAAAERVRLPVIDAARCLGCQACVDACPFDVLAVGQYVAKVARPDACCGVGSCETACPNGSLRLAAEGAPLPDRPRVDDALESLDTPGVFVAGDLTGVPLIRNAILQGAAVAARVAEITRSRTSGAGARAATGEAVLDLAVVGAGPAGLSAALRARELGLACAVFEQATIAATVRSFPRGKVVHEGPLDLPLEGALWLRECSKEELVAQWTRIVRAHRLDVRERHRATGLAPAARGGFDLQLVTPEGARSVLARHVLLAVGRRGTPRSLGAEVAPGAAGSVVTALSDARALAGKRVLVVGLGDSALEAIVAVARQPGAQVIVSYRGSGFARGQSRNIDQVRRLVAAGRVRLVFESTVARVDAGSALLRKAAGEERVPADVVLALLGGEPPRALLEASGVRLGAG